MAYQFHAINRGYRSETYTASDYFLVNVLTCVGELAHSIGYHFEELVLPDLVQLVHLLVTLHAVGRQIINKS